jgi:UDP-N-acetylglucosamine 3-dehydrogenase
MNVRVGLLGAGDFGRLHAEVLAELPGVELEVVCDPDESAGRPVADSLGVAYRADPREVLSSTSISAVVIASPEQHHAAQAEAALRAGKHALVEKPVALSAAEARALARTARASGQLLMPGHILRFVPQYGVIKEQLRPQEPVRSVFLRRNVPRRRFALHGRTHPALMSLSHDIDLLLWYLTDQQPERVYAVERREAGSENPDVFWALVEFSGGTVACLESLWTIPDGGGRYVDVELELSTPARLMSVRNPDDSVTILDDDRPVHPALSVDVRFGDQRSGALRSELAHFAAAVRGEERPRVTVEDAVRTIALAEYLVQSARERAVLDLPAVAAENAMEGWE